MQVCAQVKALPAMQEMLRASRKKMFLQATIEAKNRAKRAARDAALALERAREEVDDELEDEEALYAQTAVCMPKLYKQCSPTEVARNARTSSSRSSSSGNSMFSSSRLIL